MSKMIEEFKGSTFGQVMIGLYALMVITNIYYGIIFIYRVAYNLYYNTGVDNGIYIFAILMNALCVWGFHRETRGHWSDFKRWCQIRIYRLYRGLDK